MAEDESPPKETLKEKLYTLEPVSRMFESVGQRQKTATEFMPRKKVVLTHKHDIQLTQCKKRFMHNTMQKYEGEHS